MIPAIYEDLVSKLLVKTQNGQANWRQTAALDKYLLDFKNFALTITLQENREDPSWIGIQLRDENGKLIDSFEVGDIENQEEYNKLYTIYSAARRKALRIDEAISVITRELDSEETVGTDQTDEFIPEIEEDDVPM